MLLTCPPPHPYPLNYCQPPLHYTIMNAKTLSLDPLVSLLLIFHVLNCHLPPCDSANWFFAYYSISYDSNRVQIHSLTTCPRVPLVSSYTRFCASYNLNNPPGRGTFFPSTFIHFPFTYWCIYHLPSWYYDDAHYHVVFPPSPVPHFPHFFLTRMPSQALLFRFLWYTNKLLYIIQIFSTRGKCTGALGWGVEATMPPYPSCISCALNVSFPGSRNTNSFPFNYILNDTAKKTLSW